MPRPGDRGNKQFAKMVTDRSNVSPVYFVLGGPGRPGGELLCHSTGAKCFYFSFPFFDFEARVRLLSRVSQMWTKQTSRGRRRAQTRSKFTLHRTVRGFWQGPETWLNGSKVGSGSVYMVCDSHLSSSSHFFSIFPCRSQILVNQVHFHQTKESKLSCAKSAYIILF